LQAAERTCLMASHKTIVIAPFLREHCKEMGFDTQYIPNGVPMPEPGIGTDEIEKLGLKPNEYYLFLGRLVPEKRPDWAIRAFLETCTDSANKLVITGEASATERYVEDLKKLAEPAGDRILFTGAVYGEGKEQLLDHARTFLLPSALEGLPITLLEAMSHQRPCLVSSIPPHVDVIDDSKNGFLHDEHSYESLCERMRELENTDIETLAAVGRAALSTVAEGYDWDDIIDETERCCESALAG